MGNLSLARAKPWYTPVWFLAVVFLLCLAENLFAYKAIVNGPAPSLTGIRLYLLFLWPFVLLLETIFYYIVRKRIKERKWVWAHLFISLFSFDLLGIFYVIAQLAANDYQVNTGQLLQTIHFYCFWAGVILGHIFFIVAIIQCFSPRQPELPHDENDILSEVVL